MKEKLQWVSRLKWWQMLILFPSVLTVLGGTVRGGYEFVYHGVMGKPRLSVVEKRSLEEFKKHFGEQPMKMDSVEIDGSKVEVAYYKSDGCMLVTRIVSAGGTSMVWVPLKNETLQTYGLLETDLAFAASQQGSAHSGDRNFRDYQVGWVSPYEFMVERRFSDGCIGRFKVWAPTGETCCWVWIIYRH